VQQSAMRGELWSWLGHSSAALVLVLPHFALSADIYASAATDGSVRYATQPLDGSYRLLLRESADGAQAELPAAAPTMKKAAALRTIIEHAAALHEVPVALVEAVVAVESGYNPRAISPKGARGAMQLMPATGRTYGLADRHALSDPERNIDAGVRHLKRLVAEHRGNLALSLAAYNAGSAAVGRHGNRIPPYRETMLYVPAVLARTAIGVPAP
jgi:soluble lytic murein transglycosylase-like protein